MKKEMNSSELSENIGAIYKMMSIPIIVIIIIIQIIMIFYNAICFGIQSQEFILTVKNSWKDIYIIQFIFSFLIGGMCTLISFLDIFKKSSESGNAIFNGNFNDFMSVKGVIVQGETRRGLSILICLARNSILYGIFTYSFSSVFY